MRSKRIIPQLLLRGERLVKGTAFLDHVDVGDPVSQAMIYDAQGAEEIVIVDIDATAQERTISSALIERLVTRCRLPVAAGGGVRSIEDAHKLFRSGADKIVLNSGAVEVEGLVENLAREFGSQSVLVSLDALFLPEKNDWEVVVRSGVKRTGLSVLDFVGKMVRSGAGEVLLTSLGREGTLRGLDVALYKKIGAMLSVPLIAAGGAGCYDHLVDLFQTTAVDACSLGKMLALRDYDIVRIKAYLHGRGIFVRDA